ncbi:MAG: DoxX family protein [Deltaproteobacteria bacterium]|nr:DoxX family protein [Deltaproteobacteria bacterium]
MDTTFDTRRPISRTRWTGRVLTGLPAAFLLFDAAGKLAGVSQVADAMQHLGIPAHLTPVIGVVLLACVALYLVPRTALVGAIALTGYLGGAVMVHLRVEDPLFSHVLFPVYVGALAWAGLLVRDPRARRALLG